MVKAGVVIGSYGMPSVVELGIAAIRDTCGPVPVLVSDDATPCGEGRERLLTIPDRYPGVTLVINPRPMGHAPGDVSAFINGLEWARYRGLDVLVKFSQRFIMTEPGWLQHDAAWLMQRGYAAMSQHAHHLNMYFAMRTEAVAMQVAYAGPVINALARPCVTAAEDHVRWAYDGLGLTVGRWPRIPPDRFHRYTGVIWHNTHGVDEYGVGGEAYYELARRLGVTLGPDFSAAGWHIIAPNRPATKYAHFK